MNEYRSLKIKIIKEERLDGYRSRFLNERLEMIVSWEELVMYMLISSYDSMISKWKPLDRII